LLTMLVNLSEPHQLPGRRLLSRSVLRRIQIDRTWAARAHVIIGILQ